MTDLIIKSDKLSYDNPDADKDCKWFVPLKDGTIRGDSKYCDLSFICKQINMYSEYVEVYDKNNILIARDYLCTGKYPVFEERSRDEKAS